MTEEDTFEALQLRIVVDRFGTKCYYNHDNELHRKFGPAIEWANGSKAWFINNHRHRTDGAAVIGTNGDQYWYLNDKQLTKKDFLKHPLCTIK